MLRQQEWVLTVNKPIKILKEIPIINFDEILHSQKNPLSFFPLRRKGHLNEKGYELLVKTIEIKTKNE